MLNSGAAIGSGLLFGTGEVLHFGGPVSLWLAYFLTGTVMYAVMVEFMVFHGLIFRSLSVK